MRVRLTRRLAERINDVDLSQRSVGDIFDLLLRDARMLIAQGWAVPAHSTVNRGSHGAHTDAGDRPARQKHGGSRGSHKE